MKKLFLIVLILLGLAIAGMTYYIATIDWNKHKNVISQQFFELTGKQIVFSGPISFKIIPAPYLQASKVKILSGVADDKPLVEADNLVAKLSLLSLLHGRFDVQKMELTKPQINFEIHPDGRLNWQSMLTIEQRRKIESSEISLNSVSINNATVNFDILSHNKTFKIENINGEVIAQSAMGPFRIEGNYIKNNSPEGFAISIGQLSDSFATNLNLVLTHPESDSYIRFDGSFMLTNKVLNGNVIIEAKKLQRFIENNLPEFQISKEYDYPTAVSSDINLNEKQLSLSNFVIKYGDTQGAGDLQLEFNDGFDNGGALPRLNFAINFTDLNLDPIALGLKNFIIDQYKEPKNFAPHIGMDVIADLKSVRSTYNNQQIKNFHTNLDIIDNIITIHNLKATIPGDSNIAIKGDIKSIDEELFYNLDTSLNSQDLLTTLKWLDIEPEVSAAATYRKAGGEAKISGTVKKIQISPISFTLDKSSFNGEAGIRLGERPDIMLIINSDMINFDNYISTLPEEESAKSWGERMIYRFSKLGFLNNIDMQINSAINLGIYEKMPFENINFKANLLDGKMNIENLQIKSVADAKIELSGELTNFGKQPIVSNLNYNIQSDNFSSFMNKLELKTPDWNYKNLKNLNTIGAINGELSKFAIQTKFLLENLELNYKGHIENNQFDGTLEVKHPNFSQMLKDLNLSYNPQNQSLGQFNLSAEISGTPLSFSAENLVMNIGFNNFNGVFDYEFQNDRPQITTELNINKFECERFLHQHDNNPTSQLNTVSSSKAEFWNNPQWSDKLIKYDFYKTFDLNGKFKIKEFNCKKHTFNNVELDTDLINQNLSIKKFIAEYLGGILETTADLQMQNKPIINADIKISDADTNALPSANGNKYAIRNGKFDLKYTLSAQAESEQNFIKTLNGSGQIQIGEFDIKGWDISEIYQDLIHRTTPDGLAIMVKDNLSSGNTHIKFFTSALTSDNGIFNFNNSYLEGSDFITNISGNINLGEWSSNLLFNLKYNEPQYLPGFSFSFKESLANPIPDIDVSALFNMYQSQIDKKNEAIQAEAERQFNKLKNALNSHKETTELLLKDLKNNLEIEIIQSSDKAFDDDSKSQYAKLKEQADKINKTLSQNILLAGTDSPNEDVLTQMEISNNEQTQAIEKLRNSLKLQQLSDARQKAETAHQENTIIYDKASVAIKEYTTAQEQIRKRLNKIITDYNMSSDNLLTSLQEVFDRQSEKFKSKNDLLDKLSFITSKDDINQITQYTQELEQLKTQLSEDLTELQNTISQYIEYTSSLATRQEEAYTEKLRAQEVERKIEENTGYINIKKTGKTVTVSRDIEDIEKAEEMTADKELKVLDFSKPKSSNSTTALSPKNVVKKGRVKVN
ncbi:MAG: AsmA family protein [Alphaproteobacteria bacterium]|nr:AsmA family protein [Alphaproteobacteria bacterium]